MAELIDREALKEALLERGFYTIIVKHALEKAPTVDAVPVVRCKDCKWLYDEMDDYCCRSHRGLVRICENSFCSYGERKDNETD